MCNLQVALIDGIADVMHASSLGDWYSRAPGETDMGRITAALQRTCNNRITAVATLKLSFSDADSWFSH